MSEAETVTLRERVRERLLDMIAAHSWVDTKRTNELADAILREFRLQPAGEQHDGN